MNTTTSQLARPTPEADPPSRARRIFGFVVGALLLGSVVVFIWSAVTTSTARVNATTSGSSFFSAGTVDIAQHNKPVELLLDADGLYPGLEVEGCVDIEYRGSIPASLRFHGARLGGDGLDRFVDLRITATDIDSCSIGSGGALDELWNGRLDALWQAHPDYHRGIVLDPEMVAGDRLTLRAVATLADDNEAQGLTTDFVIVLEARP